jgi:hypothetical protein
MLSLPYLEVGHKRKNQPSVTPQFQVKPPLPSGTIQPPVYPQGTLIRRLAVFDEGR